MIDANIPSKIANGGKQEYCFWNCETAELQIILAISKCSDYRLQMVSLSCDLLLIFLYLASHG